MLFRSSGDDNLIARGNGIYREPAQYWSEVIYRSPKSDQFNYVFKLAAFTSGSAGFTRALKIEPSYYLSEKITLTGKALYRNYADWLLWARGIEQLASYEADFYRLEFRLDWYPSTRQEVRLKFEWIGIEADSRHALDLFPSGRVRRNDTSVSDFSLSDTAFQLRYRFELAPLSDIFLVYSRGGLLEDTRTDRGPGRLLEAGWDERVSESLVAKIRYRF